MSRGFICDGCDESIRGEPMLEMETSVSLKKVSGSGRKQPHSETRHYCQRCVDSKKFERDDIETRLVSLVYSAVAASSWNWGTPGDL